MAPGAGKDALRKLVSEIRARLWSCPGWTHHDSHRGVQDWSFKMKWTRTSSSTPDQDIWRRPLQAPPS